VSAFCEPLDEAPSSPKLPPLPRERKKDRRCELTCVCRCGLAPWAVLLDIFGGLGFRASNYQEV